MSHKGSDNPALPRAAPGDTVAAHDQTWATIKTLVDGGADASRLFELYYWSQEPGVIELIRVYLDMPDHTRRMLGNFLLNVRPHTIEARSDRAGRLVLSQSTRGANNNEAGKRWGSRQ